LVIEDEKEILAIAPLVYSKHNFLRFGNLKKISFVGSPESDYNNFILKEKRVQFLELFFDYLNDHIDWDYSELKDIPESTMSVDLLHGISLKKQCTYWLERESILCPFVPLPDSMETFMRGRSRHMRKNLRNFSRKLEKEHHVELKKYDEMGSIKEAMEIFFQLHQKRWESKGGLGAFNKSQIPILRA